MRHLGDRDGEMNEDFVDLFFFFYFFSFFFFIMIRLLRKDTVCKPSANVASASSREILDTND